MSNKKVQPESVFASLDETADELLLWIASFPEEKINVIPFEGSWTAGQVIMHITKAIDLHGMLLAKPGQQVDREPGKRIQEIKDIFLDFSRKMQSPPMIVPEQQTYGKEALTAAVKQSFANIRQVRGNVHLSEAVDHVAGPLTKLEILHFMVYHTQRHIQQLKNIANIVAKH